MRWIALGRTLAQTWRVAHHPSAPKAARWLVYLGIAYALWPVDLIPDALPVLGLADDAAVVPLVVWTAVRMLTRPVRVEA